MIPYFQLNHGVVMPIIRSCKSCGKEIKVRLGRTTEYCSAMCKYKDKPKPQRACINCGQMFIIKSGLVASTQKTCSVVCRDAIKPKFERPCAKCGKLFYSQAKNKARYCSKECSPVGKSITKSCEVCGTGFDVTKAKYGKQYCSIVCRGKSQQSRVKKVCIICSKEFDVKTSDKEQKTCSMQCAGVLKRKETLKKVCVICEKPFEVYPSRPDAQTCSHECAIGVRADGAKRRAFIECEQCGKDFDVANSHADRRRFCSKDCMNISDVLKAETSARTSSVNNPMWNGGYVRQSQGYIYKFIKGHPFTWKRSYILEHRFIVEERMRKEAPEHHFLVEIDGEKYLSPDIDVHHMDKDRSNNDPTNLIAVTGWAHRLIHNGKHPYKGTYWPETIEVFINN